MLWLEFRTVRSIEFKIYNSYKSDFSPIAYVSVSKCSREREISWMGTNVGYLVSVKKGSKAVRFEHRILSKALYRASEKCWEERICEMQNADTNRFIPS